MASSSMSIGSRIRTTRKTVTFTGGAGAGAAGGTVTVFTVTGDVYLHTLTAKCTTNLGEAGATATVALGTVNQATRFIAATNSVDIDANEWWVSTTPTAYSIDLPDAMQSVIIGSGDDIVITCATQNTSSGVLEFVCNWESLSTDGTLV